MRIAFVGKGGSGKTTLTALFSQYIGQYTKNRAPILVIDADLNIHLPSLLGFEDFCPEMHISHPEAIKTIKNYLRGTNQRIKELAHFRKTTPPADGSQFIALHKSDDAILSQFTKGKSDFRLMVVGTYDADHIGASCYHNNLSVLENVLSHIVDVKGFVVADMVAGVDAFSNTLHAQFDLLVLSVEPTNLGVEVFNQYRRLASDAKITDSLAVVGNKIRNISDEMFIRQRIPSQHLIGFFYESKYLRKKDQEGGLLDVAMLEKKNQDLLANIAHHLSSKDPDRQARLEKLYILHRRYVAQDFIRERFGDLTAHIDESFDLEKALRSYE